MKTDWMVTKLQDICKSGDAYVDVQTYFRYCAGCNPAMDYDTFRTLLAEQIENGELHLEGGRVYLESVWRAEETVAEQISKRLLAPPLANTEVPEKLRVGDVVLTEEQRRAVKMALSSRISCISGGAGSGKSTLIRAIVDSSGFTADRIALCAPTGKAAHGLRQKTGIASAATVHRMLLCETGAFGSGCGLKSKQLVIIDESSMLTLELLAKLLGATDRDCRMVLLGDPNQLLAIGAGNILPDLCRIGVPSLELECNHRQSGMDSALLYNISRFDALTSLDDLRFDDCFVFIEANDTDVCRLLTEEAARRRRAGEQVQVLTPRRDGSPLAAEELNRRLQAALNPTAPEKAFLLRGEVEYRDGDPVMITKNDARRDCFNGEVGRFEMLARGNGFCVCLPDGRMPYWAGRDVETGLEQLKLAYAMTIFKAQGSEYDAVLVALPQSGAVLTRNLLYTAISRARQSVVLYGTSEALHRAVKATPHPRASKLAEKTRQWMNRCA